MATGTGLLGLTQQYLAQPESRLAPNQSCRVAWEQFYEIYRRKIRAFALTCGVRPADLVDCEQEVWRELLVRLPTFQIDARRGQFDSWLFAIVRSKAVDLLRVKKVRCEDNADILDVFCDRRSDPASNIEPAEIVSLAMSRLRECISACNFRIIEMRLLEDRSVAEVASRVGLTNEQVWYRYHRARRELEAICVTLLEGKPFRKHDESARQKQRDLEKTAQGGRMDCVTPKKGENTPFFRGGSCVDYVFKRIELGRRTLSQEWKVEWTRDFPPTAVLHIRKLSIVAYAEICGGEETVNNHWPRIANAAVAAGVAAGIATIISTPGAALPIFRNEFDKHFHGKSGADSSLGVSIALAARQEPNGPWCECKE